MLLQTSGVRKSEPGLLIPHHFKFAQILDASLLNRRREHKSELSPSHDSTLSIPEKSLPQQMRARAELSLEVRWDNQDRKRLRSLFYTVLCIQELQDRTVAERSAHLTRCE